MKKIVLLIFALTFIVACKKDKKEVKKIEKETTEKITETKKVETKITKGEKRKVKVALQSKSGSSVTGNAVFIDNGEYVSMAIVIGGLTEGEHAIHIHQKADCSSDDGKSSGGHWNPTAQPHGKWGDANGFHKGDIGNFKADKNGNGTISLTTSEWCVGCGDPNKDVLGKAIIVHQGTDDFTSQPSGAAGTRVSCGGIIE